MKRTLVLLASVSFVLLSFAMGYAGEKAPQKVVDLANAKLAAYGTDATIVEAVKAENAKGKSLEQIQAEDKAIDAITFGIDVEKIE